MPYATFGSYVLFKDVRVDALGHLYRAGELDREGLAKAVGPQGRRDSEPKPVGAAAPDRGFNLDQGVGPVEDRSTSWPGAA